jgi:hypothetical protein
MPVVRKVHSTLLQVSIKQDYPTSNDQTQPTAKILNQLNIKVEPLDNVLHSAPPPREYKARTAELKEKPHNSEGWRTLAEQSGKIDKV